MNGKVIAAAAVGAALVYFLLPRRPCVKLAADEARAAEPAAEVLIATAERQRLEREGHAGAELVAAAMGNVMHAAPSSTRVGCGCNGGCR